MDVFWLEQSEADVPADEDWLSLSEAARLDSLRVSKRRADWRLGRWTAKRALTIYLNVPSDAQTLAHIEIRATASGAPEAYIGNRPAVGSISLSHRNGTAMCAIATSEAALGCDLELVEPRSDAFVADYFTAEEQALVAKASAPDRSCLATLIWSAKESALKALHEGLRLNTRYVTVSLIPKPAEQPCAENPDSALQQPESVWYPLEVRCADGDIFHGWWQQAGNLLRTLVACPAPNVPIALRIKNDAHGAA
jgi:4'-phosphopantetheinyl transferase